MNHANTGPPTLLTVKQFAERNPAFSVGSLRWLIFNADPRPSSQGTLPGNGLAPAIVRVGRRVLIDEAEFFAWVAKQRTVAKEVEQGKLVKGV